MVKDISPDSNSDSQTELTVFNGLLYFRARHPDYGDELWQTDGTEAGTTLVKDINPGAAGSSLYELTAFNGMLYFSADDGEHGDELWQSDGTGAGTTLVKDIYPGLEGSDPYEFTAVNGALFFTATDGTAGYELWKLQPKEAISFLAERGAQISSCLTCPRNALGSGEHNIKRVYSLPAVNPLIRFWGDGSKI